MSKLFDDIMEGSAEALAYMGGKDTRVRVHIPTEIDVRRIRGKLHMSQQRFAQAFGLSVDAVRHWESGRRCPESAARALLAVIDHDAETVRKALAKLEFKKTIPAHDESPKVIQSRRVAATPKRLVQTAATVRTAA